MNVLYYWGEKEFDSEIEGSFSLLLSQIIILPIKYTYWKYLKITLRKF